MKNNLWIGAALCVTLAQFAILPAQAASMSKDIKPSKGGKTPALSGGPTNGHTNVPAPVSKGGKRTKAATYTLHMDNHTDYYVNVYVGGKYGGTLGPWGDLYFTVYSGTTHVYAKAPGTGTYWNESFACYGGSYTLKLYP